MRALYILCFALAMYTSAIGSAGIDSVDAILIEYEVSSTVDARYRSLLGAPMLDRVFFLVYDDLVIVKSSRRDNVNQDKFTLYDTEVSHAYNCHIKDGRIYAVFEENYQRDLHTELLADTMREYLKFECKGALVHFEGETYQAWYTDIFDAHFAMYGEVPGIPLFFEQPHADHGKLVLEAVSVARVGVPISYFAVDQYGVLLGSGTQSRDVLTSAAEYVPFSRTRLSGEKFSSRDSTDRVIVLTFWDPTHVGEWADVAQWNALNEKFADEQVMFVALNRLSLKKAQSILAGSGLNTIQIPKSDHMFNVYQVTQTPVHFIVDMKGNIRYRYQGIFGRPLVAAMADDIKTLLPATKPGPTALKASQ